MPLVTEAAEGWRGAASRFSDKDKVALIGELERKVLWLSAWMIHHANHVRPKRDGLKVGGHQASCASVVTLMSALYFDVLRPEDRIAVKPHASPVYHAIQYLFGRQSRAQLERFRGLGGAQAYPSRTKDADEVDFATASVGLGVALTSFASLVQDYVRLKKMHPIGSRPGRMIAIVGDAEMDEGNIYEALLEGWKHDIRNVWWVIDYNRQSLDGIVSDFLFQRIEGLFRDMNWEVVTLKYGRQLKRVFRQPGGRALKDWIDECPNSLYSALTFQGGAAWREYLSKDIGGERGMAEILAAHDDEALSRLMTNLGGHDLETVLEAFHAATTDQPTCFIAYTIKGAGLPIAGHKDNHAGLMSPEQMAAFKRANRIPDGQEWDPVAGLDRSPDEIAAFLASVPFTQGGARRLDAPKIAVPERLPVPAPSRGAPISTQDGFGRILGELGRANDAFARHLVTTSPDVSVSTNLGPWVNRRGVFRRSRQEDVFRERKVPSPQLWTMSPEGQHIELGIAEQNLFLLLASLGLAHSLFGVRLLPVGTLYDPFVKRGLDALSYACYQDARFMVVGTPSGISLAPEGGQHQSVYTPLIGLGQDRLSAFEPAYVDELAAIMRWGFEHMQADDGGAVYLRLSTRPIEQPERAWSDELSAGAVAGGYWMVPPAPGAELAIVYQGVVAPEALAAHRAIREDVPGAGLLAVTSADRLYRGWRAAQRRRRTGERGVRAPVETLLAPLAPDAALVTAQDGHPATLSWLGSVARHAVHPLGVDAFGQSGDIADLYRLHGIDAEAIIAAAALALLERGGRAAPGPA
ncbi:MAG: transketolase [Proteobacteria bacterium]|nr:transketolase [Pseudomonadota bacterium]